MSRPYGLVAATAALVVALASGCTTTTGSDAEASGQPAPGAAAQTATVERHDVVGVLTLDGVVSARGAYQVHTPVAGTVTAVTGTGITVTSADGATVTMAYLAGSQVTSVAVEVGSRVRSGLALAEVTAPGFTITAALDAADLLRFVSPPLGARAQVVGGSGPFDCPLLDPIPTAGDLGSPDTAGDPAGQQAGSGGSTQIVCAVPDDAAVLAGMDAIMVVQLERADGALTLPVEAVAGTVDAGKVYLRADDGTAHEVDVTLGTSDGVRIVVTSGLREGQQVLVPGPWLGRRDG